MRHIPLESVVSSWSLWCRTLWVLQSLGGPKQLPVPLWRHVGRASCAVPHLTTQTGWKEYHADSMEVPVLWLSVPLKGRTLSCVPSCKVTAWVAGAAGPCWGICSSASVPSEQLLKSCAGSWEQMNWHSRAFSSEAQIASPNGDEVSLLIWPVFCYFEHIPCLDLFPSTPYGVDTLLLLCCPYKTFHYSQTLCFAEFCSRIKFNFFLRENKHFYTPIHFWRK